MRWTSDVRDPPIVAITSPQTDRQAKPHDHRDQHEAEYFVQAHPEDLAAGHERREDRVDIPAGVCLWLRARRRSLNAGASQLGGVERAAKDKPADHGIERCHTKVSTDENVKTAAKSCVTRGWRGGRPVISLIRACCSLTLERTKSIAHRDRDESKHADDPHAIQAGSHDRRDEPQIGTARKLSVPNRQSRSDSFLACLSVCACSRL